MVRVRSPQDLGAGLILMLIGAAGLIFGRDLAFGTSARMGPGYFPTVLSVLIIGIGLIVAGRGLTVQGPPIERIQPRPILFVIAAILASGFLLNAVGLALTAVLVTIIAAYARREVDLRETVVLGVGMAIFSIVVFVYALGQPLPAWWGR